MSKKKYPLNDIHYLAKHMQRVESSGYLIREGRLASTFWDIARSANADSVSESSVPGFAGFLEHYQDEAMELRTNIHPVIAATIQKKIDEFPDHMHFITCGDEHVRTNPLYRFIRPPTGTFGIADQNSI